MSTRPRLKWMIFIDDTATDEQWDRAEPYINGWQTRRNKRQAFKYAERISTLLQCPMCVHNTQERGRAYARQKLMKAYIIDPKPMKTTPCPEFMKTCHQCNQVNNGKPCEFFKAALKAAGKECEE